MEVDAEADEPPEVLPGPEGLPGPEKMTAGGGHRYTLRNMAGKVIYLYYSIALCFLYL